MKLYLHYLICILLVLVLSAVSILWMTGSDQLFAYINDMEPIGDRGAAMEIDPDTGYYCFTGSDGEDFRVLRLSDIHIGGGYQSLKWDKRTLSETYQVIAETRPDLIVLSGDMIYSSVFVSGCLNNVHQMKLIVAFMERIGIPWTVTFGNHEADPYALYSREQISSYLENCGAEHLIYQAGPEEITGYGNTFIQVENPDGSVNMIYALLDSNAYEGWNVFRYDYIHEDQTIWYAEQIQKLADKYTDSVTEDLPSIMIIHIPVTEYQTAYQLYQEGSDQVKWLDIGDNRENKEQICSTGQPECETIFDTVCRLGSTKMIVCGHDHYNSFGIEYRGIRLCYGLALDHLSYQPIDHSLNSKNFFRGGTLISTDADGKVTLLQDRLYEEDTSMSYYVTD